MSIPLAATAILVVWTAGILILGIVCVWQPLRSRGARPVAFVVASIALGLVPVVVAIGTLARLQPGVIIVASALPVVVLSLAISRLVNLTGGPTPEQSRNDAVIHGIGAAQQLYRMDDIDGWRTALKALDGIRTPDTVQYLELWQRFSEEEARRRNGEQVSSQGTIQAIDAAGRYLMGQPQRPPLGVLAGAVALGLAVAVVPAIALAVVSPERSDDACASASAILDRAESSPIDTAPDPEQLSHLVITDPGTLAEPIEDGGLDLEAAAESRHDPHARDELAAAGFQSGYSRMWLTVDGRLIGAEVFEFATPLDAAQFERAATSYACRFANLAFRDAVNGVGLQIRYSTGDPITEQLAWVDGRRRVLVVRTFLAPPADHDDIRYLDGLARGHLELPHG